jgi:hypothetical protein
MDDIHALICVTTVAVRSTKMLVDAKAGFVAFNDARFLSLMKKIITSMTELEMRHQDMMAKLPFSYFYHTPGFGHRPEGDDPICLHHLDIRHVTSRHVMKGATDRIVTNICMKSATYGNVTNKKLNLFIFEK